MTMFGSRLISVDRKKSYHVLYWFVQKYHWHQCCGATGDNGDVPPPPVPDMTTSAATMERSLEKMVSAAFARTGRPQTRTPPGSRSGSNGSQRAGRRIPSASPIDDDGIEYPETVKLWPVLPMPPPAPLRK